MATYVREILMVRQVMHRHSDDNRILDGTELGFFKGKINLHSTPNVETSS